jgi:threonine/homoserine/homoserine lactone efflux protein
MELDYFVKGILIGFSLAIPVGPIGLLLIRRTLARGRVSGLASGLGAATADAVYGSVAGFGVTLLSNFLVENSDILRVIGGAFLCYLGVKIFLSKPSEKTPSGDGKSFFSDYISTVALTLTNPATILTFAAVFAASGVGHTHGHYWYTIFLVIGVFCGSATWWLVLTSIISVFHGRFESAGLSVINKLSGTLIALFGLAIFLSLIFFPRE